MRELPEVVGVDQQVLSNRLLKAPVELVAEARLNRHAGRTEYVLGQPADPGRAREQQILIERCFKSSRVSYPQNRSGLLDVISNPSRGSGPVRNQTIVTVKAEPNVEQEVACRDRILRIERVLVDVGGGMEPRAFRRGQVEGKQADEKGAPVTSGLFAALGSSPAAAPCTGDVSGGSAAALPSAISCTDR